MKSDQFWSRMTTDDFTVWTSKQQRLKPQAYILNTFHTDYHLLEHVIEHVSNLECNRMIIRYNLYRIIYTYSKLKYPRTRVTWAV